MDWAAALTALPVWQDIAAVPAASPGQQPKALPTAASSQELLAARLLPREAASKAKSRRLAVFTLASQQTDSTGAEVCSRVVVRIDVVGEGEARPDGSASLGLTLQVEVPEYDVEQEGAFQQILLSGGSGVLLLAPRCCAVFVTPDFGEVSSSSEAQVRAVSLLPDGDAEILRVLWHPLSNTHIGMLLSTGSWQLLNLAYRASMAEPEVYFDVAFGSAGSSAELAVDFAFVAAGPGAGWAGLSVLFLGVRGSLCVRCPVLPAATVWQGDSLREFRAAPPSLEASQDRLRQAGSGFETASVGSESAGLEAHDWLRRTLLEPSNCSDEPLAERSSPGSFIKVQHPLHLHGKGDVYHRRWIPVEQQLVEERTQGDVSPRSPRHQRSGYCSLVLVAHSPLVVIARATTTGLVELLLLNGPLAPCFGRSGGQPSSNALEGSLSCSVFEEIDLVLPSGKPSALRLLPAPSHVAQSSEALLVVQTRTLLATIELPWVSSLLCGAGAPSTTFPAANVTTLVEVRTADGPSEIAGWHVLPQAASSSSSAAAASQRGSGSLAGLWLRVKTDAGSTSGAAPEASFHVVNISAVLQAAAKARAAKASQDGASSSAAPSRDQSVAGSSCADGSGARPKGYLQHLSAPTVLPSPLFVAASGTGSGSEPPAAAAAARAVATVQSGQVADLAARQVILRHFCSQLPGRVAAVKAELSEVNRSGAALRKDAADCSAQVKCIQERQAKIEQHYGSIFSALTTELQLRSMDSIATNDLPRLWAQLHELRNAFELLRAAASQAPPEGTSSQHSTVSELQRTWTSASADHLRAQAAAVEQAVSAALEAAAERSRVAEDAGWCAKPAVVRQPVDRDGAVSATEATSNAVLGRSFLPGGTQKLFS
mmetsp:Transcript_8057/g.17503  ORF Transcript_8057/g.17503 Transcript_8057/m.17503 type:complete len:882 (+) Transcript_8057:52-2697(+)